MSQIFIDNNTATVTKDFLRKSKIFGTPEFFKVLELKEKYDIKEFKTRSRTTKNIHNDNSTEANLTQKNMITYIKTLESSKQLLAELDTIRQRSKVQPNPKQYIIDWFKKACPNYTEIPVNDETHSENIVPIHTAAENK